MWPQYFEVVRKGNKIFELRLDVFQCKEGDILILKEWDPKTKNYTGRTILKKAWFVEKILMI